MFQIVAFDEQLGTFAKIKSFNDFDAGVKEFEAFQVSYNNAAIFVYENEEALEENAEFNIIQKILEVNKGRITRVTKGASIRKVETHGDARPVCCGGPSTACFCVITPGSKRCETQYCNAAGLCWWVPCSIPCGC